MDYIDVISRRKVYPKLSELLTDIQNGELKVKVVIVPSLKVFRNLDLYLFVRKILDLNGVELLSLKRGENLRLKKGLKELEKNAKRNTIIELSLYSLVIGASLYVITLINP